MLLLNVLVLLLLYINLKKILFPSNIIVYMKVKWIEYSTEFPYIYSVACLLDPEMRKEGLENMLRQYSDVLTRCFI